MKTFLKVLGFAGYVLLTSFATMFAIASVMAFISMFTDSLIFGLFGTVSAGFLAYTCWTIRKDTLV